MHRTVLVVLLVVLVGLAGCVGVNGDGDDPETIELDDVDDTDVVEDDPADDTDTEDTDGDDEESAADDVTDQPDTDDEVPAVDGTLELHHIDVGQADSTLVVTPEEETILIDTGHWQQNGAVVIEYLEEMDIYRIDHLVATHGHADHIGGHAEVIEHFETERDGIGNIYDSGVPHTTQTYENYLDAVDAYDHELLLVEDGDTVPLDDDSVNVQVINPPAGDSGDDLHYNSVSLRIEFGNVTYLTTGDAETEAEERMVDDWNDSLDSDLYQAGHHGSSTSSSTPFMDAVAPDIAIISSDFDSQFGHPHDEVLTAFADRDIETYWTGVPGDILVTTDGDSSDVETTEPCSTDAEELLEEKPADDSAALGHPEIVTDIHSPGGVEA